MLFVYIGVETDEINVLRAEKLGGRETGEREERFRIDPLAFEDQFIDEVGDGACAAPAPDVGRNFVGDAERKDGGMAAARVNGAANSFAGGSTLFGGIEKTELSP